MNDLKLITILISLLALFLCIENNNTKKLNIGDIAFTGFNASNNDSFSIITLVYIKPNTTIHFTDSEWNGTRFGADESNLTWNSGDKIIPAGTTITFKSINKNPCVNYGRLKNLMKLSKKKEAIFAYTGKAPKLPNTFLAAVANNSSGYGTLINTGLLEGNTAITYPMGSYYAKFNINQKYKNKEDYLSALNKMENYNFNKNIEDFNIAAKKFSNLIADSLNSN